MFLITGCGKGIGREALKSTCENYSEPVVGIYRTDIQNYDDLKKYENKLLLIKGDVSEKNIYETCFKLCLKKFNKLPDKFIINAGMRLRKNIEDVGDDTLGEIWDINYFALRNLIKELILNGVMNNKISLVYVSSIVSSLGFADLDDYGATKSAAESLIRSISVRFPKSRFNSVAPGFTETSYAKSFRENQTELYDWTLSRTPMSRWGSSEEIVDLIEFLLSSKSTYITGQTFKIDGGWSSNA